MKKTIQELVAECGLVPSDIVKLSDGRLSIGQASVWLREFKLSMPAELLLEWYCKRKVEEGVGPLPVGRKKSVVAGIFSGRKATGQYGSQIVEFEAAKVEMETKMEDVLEAVNASNKKEFSRIVSEKIPAKNKNMKKENPYLEERVIYEGPFTGSAADFIEAASKMPVNPNMVFRDMEYGSIGDILPVTPSATPTNFASWGVNMTMKRVGNIVKLNTNDKSYTIDFEKAKSGFLVDGKKYLLSDFKDV